MECVWERVGAGPGGKHVYECAYCDRPPVTSRMPPELLHRECGNPNGQREDGVSVPARVVEVIGRPLVLVLGVHRSLSSCLAEILETLGVFMGRNTNGGECAHLRHVCEKIARFPRAQAAVGCGDRDRIQKWLKSHVKAAGDRPAGAKYPHLCFLAGEIERLCPNLRIIDIARPLSQSIKSLTTRSATSVNFHATAEECNKLQRALHTAKRTFLKDRPHLRIVAEKLLRDPASVIDRVIEYLRPIGMNPTPEQRQEAIDHVQPGKAPHTPTSRKLPANRWTDETTIVIKTHERRASLDRGVCSLLEEYPEAKIIVADDSRHARRRYDVDYHRLPFDTGLAGGRNYLVDQVETPYVLVLDDDFCRTAKTDFVSLHRALVEHELDILAAQPTRLNRPTLIGRFRQEGDILHLDRIRVERKEEVVRADWVPNLFIARTDALRRCRWDDRCKLGEHVDFFLRAREMGLRCGMLAAVEMADGPVKTDSPQYRRHRQRAFGMHQQSMARWARRLKFKRFHNAFPSKPCGDLLACPVVRISKRLHQIWIGPNTMPEDQQGWCQRWRELHPDWEYKLWNEEEALELLWPNLKPLYDQAKHWAQKADFLRYAIVYYHGGVYTDTDFEPFKPLDPLLDELAVQYQEAFVPTKDDHQSNAIFGAVQGHPFLGEMFRRIPDRFSSKWPNSIGPKLLTEVVAGFNDVGILPPEAFYPVTWTTRHRLQTHGHYGDNCYGVHHFAGSWT